MAVDSNTVAVTWTLDIACVSSKNLSDIQATSECRFTLKHEIGMIKMHGQKQ